jgi:hypothetical protein
MARRRPELEKGYICRYSKRARHGRDTVLVVLGVHPKSRYRDTSDGRTTMICSAPVKSMWGKSNKSHKVHVLRRDLWWTGAIAGQKKELSYFGQIKKDVLGTAQRANNNGHSHCLKCGQPTKAVMGAWSTYHMCKNRSCVWFDN